MKGMRLRPGFTVLEVMVAAGIFMVIFMGSYTLMETSMTSFRRTRAQTNSDVDATVMSMQRMISEVREAKKVVLTDGVSSNLISSKWMQLTFPLVGADGRYDRNVPDPASLVEYYQSNSTGNPSVTGTWLWRRAGGSMKPLCRNIERLTFTSDTPRSVRISVQATHALFAPDDGSIVTNTSNPSAYAHTDLVQRVVYLRNF